MKVAIIGAGIAGLCCAHELERHGIAPVIYERYSFIGEPYPHVTAILNIVHRSVKDAVRYFKSLNIDLKPLSVVNNAVHKSPNRMTTIKGNLGYTFLYTKDEYSIKRQLVASLKNTKILFNEMGDYKKLSKIYDYVVISTGTSAFAEELGIWQPWLQAYVKGAVIQGNFDLGTVFIWINKKCLKNGYAYMTSFSPKKAAIIIVVPDINEKEVDHYWELFLHAEDLKYEIVEEFKLNHHSGYVYPKIVDNVIFVGNAAGGIDPFLGFGALNAVTTGVAAARTIAQAKDYEKQIKHVMDHNIQMRQFRKMFDMLDDKSYDKLIRAIGLPGVKHLLYHSPLNVAAVGAFASKFILKGNGSKV